MGDFYITGMTDTTCPVLINPEWSFQNQDTMIQSRHRTQAGELISYIWGEYSKFVIPVRFVDSSAQSRINSWWRSGEDVALTMNSSEEVSTVIGRLIAQSNPVDRFMRPYRDLYEGRLHLETSSAGIPAKTRRPFILDDTIFGLLDKNYNALL